MCCSHIVLPVTREAARGVGSANAPGDRGHQINGRDPGFCRGTESGLQVCSFFCWQELICRLSKNVGDAPAKQRQLRRFQFLDFEICKCLTVRVFQDQTVVGADFPKRAVREKAVEAGAFQRLIGFEQEVAVAVHLKGGGGIEFAGFCFTKPFALQLGCDKPERRKGDDQKQ